MSKELTSRIEAARARVTAAGTLVAEAAVNVTASDFSDVLNSIASESLKEHVRRFLQLPIKVLNVNAESYNEQGTGSAGCEVSFVGATKSAIAYGEETLDLDTMILLGKYMADLNREVEGVEAELLRSPEHLTMLFLADADRGKGYQRANADTAPTGSDAPTEKGEDEGSEIANSEITASEDPPNAEELGNQLLKEIQSDLDVRVIDHNSNAARFAWDWDNMDSEASDKARQVFEAHGMKKVRSSEDALNYEGDEFSVVFFEHAAIMIVAYK